MRYAVLDNNGLVLNVIIADAQTAAEIERTTGHSLVPHDTASPGWRFVDGDFVPPPAPAPPPQAPDPTAEKRGALRRAIQQATAASAGLDDIKRALQALADLLT